MDGRAVWRPSVGFFGRTSLRRAEEPMDFGCSRLFRLDKTGKHTCGNGDYTDWLLFVVFLLVFCCCFFLIERNVKTPLQHCFYPAHNKDSSCKAAAATAAADSMHRWWIWSFQGPKEDLTRSWAASKPKTSQESGVVSHEPLTAPQNNKKGNVTGLFGWTTSLFLFSFFSDKQDALCTTLVLIHFGFVPTFLVF